MIDRRAFIKTGLTTGAATIASDNPATNAASKFGGTIGKAGDRLALIRQVQEYFPLSISNAACITFSGRPRSRQ